MGLDEELQPTDSSDDPTPPSDGRNVDTSFRGQTRSNATHASTTDPDAKLYRKGRGMEAKLAFLGHADGEPLWISRRCLPAETCPGNQGEQKTGGKIGINWGLKTDFEIAYATLKS